MERDGATKSIWQNLSDYVIKNSEIEKTRM